MPNTSRRPARLHFSRFVSTACGTGLVLAASSQVFAQISYTVPGSIYSQNFDSLPNTPENTSLGSSPVGWIDDTTAPGATQFSILGWYLYYPLVTTEGGANGHQRVRIGAGTANTGSFMSFGASGSTERALGNVGANTLAAAGSELYVGLRLRNDSGVTLDSFTLSYNGEQWRDGGSATPNSQGVSFMWSTAATAISDTNTLFNSVGSLGYSSPVFVNTTTGAAVDGNTTGRVAVGPVTVEGLNWGPGTDLWLRWADQNNAGNDHGLAIDDLSFSAAPVVPEPGTWAFMGLGLLAWLGFRRFKS